MEYTDRYLDSQDVILKFIRSSCEVLEEERGFSGDSLRRFYDGFSSYREEKGHSHQWCEETVQKYLVTKGYLPSDHRQLFAGDARSIQTRLRVRGEVVGRQGAWRAAHQKHVQ